MEAIEHYKRGGKVKGKGKGKASATATNTVHVHVTRAAPRHSTSRVSGASGGNLAMERQLSRLIHSLGNMMPSQIPTYTHPGFTNIPMALKAPSHSVGIQTKLPVNDIGMQAHITKRYTDTPIETQTNPDHTIYDLAREHQQDMNTTQRRKEFEIQEKLSHASHLPASIDHGDPAEIRMLPFTNVSYGDELSTETRMIGDAGSVYQENYPHRQPTSAPIPAASNTPPIPVASNTPPLEVFSAYDARKYGLDQYTQIITHRDGIPLKTPLRIRREYEPGRPVRPVLRIDRRPLESYIKPQEAEGKE